MKPRIDIIFTNEKGIKYAKGMELEGKYDKTMYILLACLCRTLQKKFEIPFYCDLESYEDGSISGCKFEINKERLEEMSFLDSFAG